MVNIFLKKVKYSYITRTVGGWPELDRIGPGVLWCRAWLLLWAALLSRAFFRGLTSLTSCLVKVGHNRCHGDIRTGVVGRSDCNREPGEISPLDNNLFLKICILVLNMFLWFFKKMIAFLFYEYFWLVDFIKF